MSVGVQAASPSATAQLIAAALVAERMGGRRHGCVAPLAADVSQELLGMTRLGRVLAALARSRLGRGVLRAVERATVPGIGGHYVLRKAWIEDAVRDAVADGCSRVWVLGAGLDTLALRLAIRGVGRDHAEFDHPGTQGVKRSSATYAGSGVGLREADLGTDQGLAALGGPAEPGVVVAEGLLMYLPEERVRALLRAAAEATARPGRLVATFMLAPRGRPGFVRQTALGSAVLDWFGEPMRWGAEPQRAAELMRDCGWRVRGVIAPGSPPACPGECVAIADRL